MFSRDQPLLHQLPDEVLQDRIITLLPSADQAAVRRTSKLLYNMSTRPFFRYLSLSEIPQIVKCCKVLTAKPEFADAVRELIIAGPRRRLDGPLFPSFLRLFARTVVLLRRVTHLDLNIIVGLAGPVVPSILSDQCDFPLLRELKLLDMSLLSPTFLRRHSTIEHLGLRQILCPCEPPVFDEHRVVVPKLRTFIGPFKLLPFVIPNSAVYHAGLMCGHILPPLRWVNLMLCLRKSSVPIWVFECHMRAFQKDMMFAIGDYLPELRVLRLLDKHVWTEPEARDMLVGLGALKTVLPQLRHLQSIELLLVEGPPNLRPNTEQILGIVSGFGDNCPSLRHMAMCE
ncbi:hypothetical protein PILCRDRAFT_475157 [Piloderma croceum F 1598]|uniref:F-box domain-containing protein n=1 Tax=Piloderma croceum (strain F 1598) TaxID=765440 RepID=A0A0C3B7P1_PILCF|nr:hypothetical protein PILCRDRAFT_475157 [Piloderma croceum F 1598]